MKRAMETDDVSEKRAVKDAENMQLSWHRCQNDDPNFTHMERAEKDPEFEGCIEISRDDDRSRNVQDGDANRDFLASGVQGAELSSTNMMKAASKSHFKYASDAYGLRMMSKKMFNTKVNLEVENLMIVIKHNDVSLLYLARELVGWLLDKFPSITIYVDEELKHSKALDVADLCKDSNCPNSKIKFWNQQFLNDNVGFFDLVMTLGGDGTVLYVSSILQSHVPPIMSFALGSLGFLTNFKFEYFKTDLPLILNNKIKTNLRMRLQCKVFRRQEPVINPQTGKKICVSEFICERHILNEVTIDRGPSPFISNLELYGDGSLLTVAQADGIIVATPTGSTAYSLSAGGSLVYPSVNAIAVTPICPHTLSFRPIILPDSMSLKVKVSSTTRATAWASFDGKNRVELRRGDYITICASPYAFPTLESSSTEFVDGISRSLNWNVREQQKSFTHMLSLKNQEKMASESFKDKEPEEIVEEVEVGKDSSEKLAKLEQLLRGTVPDTSNASEKHDRKHDGQFFIP